jgi:hypothetical protein
VAFFSDVCRVPLGVTKDTFYLAETRLKSMVHVASLSGLLGPLSVTMSNLIFKHVPRSEIIEGCMKIEHSSQLPVIPSERGDSNPRPRARKAPAKPLRIKHVRRLAFPTTSTSTGVLCSLYYFQ